MPDPEPNSKTGSQNRPYYPGVQLWVRATFTMTNGEVQSWLFDWNDRASVRRFASDADRVTRSGGIVMTQQEPK